MLAIWFLIILIRVYVRQYKEIYTGGIIVYKIVNDFPNELFKAKEGPFISLYQPTHRHSPENKQDVIRFKNLIKEIERSLEQKYPKRETKSIIDLFVKLGEDKEFWMHTYDGIGILYAEGQAIIYKLNRPTKELVVVSDNFHIKPLIRNFQSADRYHALGLNKEGFTLFEGNRYGFDELDLDDDMPNNIKEVLGEDFTSSYITGRYGGAGNQGNYHSYNDKKEESRKDIEKFFRFVDRTVLENYSRPTKLPLVLVALPEYHTLFRKISHNPFLLEEGIKTNYDILSIDKLKDKMWEKIEPLYVDRTGELVKKFQDSRAQYLGSDDITQIAKASAENRIDTVLIESDRVLAGRINRYTGRIESGELSHPEFGDILNDIAEIVINNGGSVIMLPKDRMPSTTGAAATYRF